MANRDMESYTSRKSTRKQQIKVVTLVIYALAALLLILLLVLCISAIADSCSGDSGEVKLPTESVQFGSLRVTEEDAKTGTLVLANELNPYSISDDDPSLTDVYNYRSQKHGGNNPYQLSGMFSYMNKTALTALDEMLTACAQETGVKNVLVRVAYMTEAERQANPGLLKTHADDWKTGLGAELRIMTETGNAALTSNATVYAWFAENAAKYGFIERYPVDKATMTGVAEYIGYFRYVGVAHATYIKANGLCLEEYLEFLTRYTSKDRLTITGADGKTYEVYHCEVSGSGAAISCPTNYAYTLSGTNKGGVVVTIDRTTAVDQPISTGGESSSDSLPVVDTTPETGSETTPETSPETSTETDTTAS